ncbi:MAG: Trm112 family protein [Pseudomonadota bacterium]
MSIDSSTLEIIACPSCKGKLVYWQSNNELVCRGEQLAYPVEEGIPVLIADKARTIESADLEQIPS